MRSWLVEITVFNGRYYKTVEARIQASTLRAAIARTGDEVRKLFPRRKVEEVLMKVRPL